MAAKILAAFAGDDAAATNELGDDGEDDERGENGGHHRVEVRRIFPGPHAEKNHHQADGDGADGGIEEIAFQAFEGSFAPGEQRSNRREQHQQKSNRDRHAIEKRRTDGDFVALNQFGKDRKKRAPQNGEADDQQKKIVEQETGFAGDQRFQLVLVPEVREIFDQEKMQTARVRPMKTRNQVPIEDCAKACTELITPERVRKVPSMESRKVAKMRTMFQTFSMPRFSCIITECRNAVPVSQGIDHPYPRFG